MDSTEVAVRTGKRINMGITSNVGSLDTDKGISAHPTIPKHAISRAGEVTSPADHGEVAQGWSTYTPLALLHGTGDGCCTVMKSNWLRTMKCQCPTVCWGRCSIFHQSPVRIKIQTSRLWDRTGIINETHTISILWSWMEVAASLLGIDNTRGSLHYQKLLHDRVVHIGKCPLRMHMEI